MICTAYNYYNQQTHGSGGREIGRRAAEQLRIPFYDRAIVEQAARDGNIDISFFENSETKGVGSLIYDLSADSHVMLPITDGYICSK